MDLLLNMVRNENGYKWTLRHQACNLLYEYLANSLEQDTKLQVFRKQFTTSLLYDIKEIEQINEYWMDKLPIKIMRQAKTWGGDIFLDEKEDKIIPPNLQIFFDELDRFLDDSVAYKEVMKYIDSNYNGAGKEKYYIAVQKRLKQNKKLIKSGIANCMQNNKWLRAKLSNIGIGKEWSWLNFFGLKSGYCSTYLRHFLLYMLSLSKEQDYKIQIKTDVFRYKPQRKKYFNVELLEKNWYIKRKDRKSVPTAEFIAQWLVPGKTHETIRKVVPYLFFQFGEDTARKVMSVALEEKNVDKLRRRIKDVEYYISYLKSKSQSVIV